MFFLILRRVHLLQVLHPSRSSAWVFALEDGLSRVQYWHWTGCLRIPSCTQTLILAVQRFGTQSMAVWISDWSLVMYHWFIYTWWFQLSTPCEKQKRVKAVHLPQASGWKLKNKSFETTGRWKNSCTTFYLVTCGLLKPCEKWGDILKYQLVVWDSFHHHQQYRQVFADWNLPRLIRELHIATRWSVVWEDLFGFLAEKNQKNEAKAQKKVLKQRW